jgi:hypothetical protein
LRVVIGILVDVAGIVVLHNISFRIGGDEGAIVWKLALSRRHVNPVPRRLLSI